MLFNSSQLGAVEVDETTIITFANGIPALENCTRFKLFHDADKTQPSVFWLQSLDNPDITISLTTPQALGVRFEVELDDAEVAQLALTNPGEAAILLMLYQEQADDDSHPALGRLSANLRNPLVFNLSSRQALQKTGLVFDILVHNKA
ncbi:flagellar assembly protein FliW [uncultured Aquitalea sp.]|uniref:flagellar assembly protein FliW n=1 Tax=uncultured Aquitalea sp. TaxID=540272 RepID=UPI0025D676EB|nr:flagellar assembly protein FliW [uncultured Aquitalea sp.]